MPRARNIKHGFFTNDDLAENHPLGRLLFIGMWTLADYKGDLKWKTKRIKTQLLPYDECDVESLAINLDKSGFIRFYSDGENIYVRVLNFERHQNPHLNEKKKGSDIPEYTDELRQLIDLEGLAINRDKSGLIPSLHQSDPADSCFLNPDSRSLNPDSDTPLNPPQGDSDDPKPTPDDPPQKAKPTKRNTKLPKDFELTEHRTKLAVNYWASKDRWDLNVEDQFFKFRAHHKAKGSTMADWDAAWQTWYGKAVEFTKPPGGQHHATGQRIDNSAAGRTRQGAQRALEELRREEERDSGLATDGLNVRP